MPEYVYILTIRDNSGIDKLIANLGVFHKISSALSFVISEKNNPQNRYIKGGILKYLTVDALDAYTPQDFGNFVYLYSNDFYKVIAEKSVLY